jgi:hypothetical protein
MGWGGERVLGRLGRDVVWSIDYFLLSGVKLLHFREGTYLTYIVSLSALS